MMGDEQSRDPRLTDIPEGWTRVTTGYTEEGDQFWSYFSNEFFTEREYHPENIPEDWFVIRKMGPKLPPHGWSLLDPEMIVQSDDLRWSMVVDGSQRWLPVDPADVGWPVHFFDVSFARKGKETDSTFRPIAQLPSQYGGW